MPELNDSKRRTDKCQQSPQDQGNHVRHAAPESPTGWRRYHVDTAAFASSLATCKRLALLALTPLALQSVASSQILPVIDGIAYAHISLAISLEGGEAVGYALEGSIYPRAQIEWFCVAADCKAGIATPLGYGYQVDVFEKRPGFHVEEIMHLRQWEALGPAFLLAYAATGGEPFEPYTTRESVIASASSDVPYWDLARMWRPPPELSKRFPQFRAEWARDGVTTFKFLPGYAELLQATLKYARMNHTLESPAN